MGHGSLLLMMLLLVCVNVLLVTVECSRDYITWDDLKVDGESSRTSGSSRKRDSVIVVDHKGAGHSKTVQGAVDMVPEGNRQRVKIVIRPGIYREKVHVPKTKPYISFLGNLARANKTVISYNSKASDKDANGSQIGTQGSATVTVESDFFCAAGVTIQNTVVAVPGARFQQAVALRVTGDRAVFYKLRVLGTQDTLLDEAGRHYYLQSYIEGIIDFVCGNGKSLFQDCVLHSKAKGMGAIAAQKRESPTEDTGFSFVNCTIKGSGKIYLGRAWGKYSRTIYANCYMHNIIDPAGWGNWNHEKRKPTYGEYDCKGAGAIRSDRVPWSKSLSYNDAMPFLDKKYINKENWLQLS